MIVYNKTLWDINFSNGEFESYDRATDTI